MSDKPFSDIKTSIVTLIEEVVTDDNLTEDETLEIVAALGLAGASIDYAFALREEVGRLSDFDTGYVAENRGHLKHFVKKVLPDG
jgi:hypothetical protein